MHTCICVYAIHLRWVVKLLRQLVEQHLDVVVAAPGRLVYSSGVVWYGMVWCGAHTVQWCGIVCTAVGATWLPHGRQPVVLALADAKRIHSAQQPGKGTIMHTTQHMPCTVYTKHHILYAIYCIV